jgi:NhaP-type Na+/H+ or K+/H+ antiporter
VALQIFPAAMVPGGKLWSLLLLWCVSYHAGEGFERAGAPKALGMLVAGLVLRSLPHGKDLSYPLDNLVTWWSKDIRAGAMALVLLRAGLGMDLSSVRAYGWSLPLMATLPSLIESVVGAAFATYLFGMPFLLAWVMSFMVAAVGPAIIASGCAAVKEKGYAPRAPNFLMTTAVFDDTTCIIGFNCLLRACACPRNGYRLPARYLFARHVWLVLTRYPFCHPQGSLARAMSAGSTPSGL